MMIEVGSDIIGVSERSWRSEERHGIRKEYLPVELPLLVNTFKMILF